MDNNIKIKTISNFNWELTLSRQGMVNELKSEIEVIKFCIEKIDLSVEQNGKTIDKILVMPLRKLLCERNSILLQLCPNFKISPLIGPIRNLHGGLNTISPSISVLPKDQWISIDEFLQSKIAWFERGSDYPPNGFYSEDYKVIRNKLKGENKNKFENYFAKETIFIDGVENLIYVKKEDVDNQELGEILDLAGYNSLTIYDFLKHHSDKLGAHIDFETSPFIRIINQRNVNSHGHFFAISLIMIDAIRKEIPELTDYLNNFEGLVVR